MPTISFKNRIAFYNLAAGAALILLVFIVIYRVVAAAVNYDINHDLQAEVQRHIAFVAQQKPYTSLIEKNEWNEKEHLDIVINPVFLQFYDAAGNALQKSPNLKKQNLLLHPQQNAKQYTDTQLSGLAVRQVQTPLINNGKIRGHVVIAMSIEQPHMVLHNLRIILYITFPVVLIILFFVTWIIAGKSMAPALNIISTTKKITDNNFDQRITLPANKDELYVLSSAINDLLKRIENAMAREKQFTSDASHELRTPLAVIRGTLEVLIRKPRETAEYEDRINYCITEVNRLTTIVEQLLLLARFESHKASLQLKNTAIDEVVLHALERYSPEITTKKITIDFSFQEHFYVTTDIAMISIIIENLLSNAIKYSYDGGYISVELFKDATAVTCTISDKGRGIAQADLARVYEQFYRSEATEHTNIKGTGLGLSIVKRLCDMLGITIAITSEKGSGTVVKLVFTKL